LISMRVSSAFTRMEGDLRIYHPPPPPKIFSSLSWKTGLVYLKNIWVFLVPFHFCGDITTRCNLKSNNLVQSIKSDQVWHQNITYMGFAWWIIMGGSRPLSSTYAEVKNGGATPSLPYTSSWCDA
jgi:hypothetical protein